MKKAKRKFLKEGSSPKVVEKDYDDDGAFEDVETKKIMKKLNNKYITSIKTERYIIVIKPLFY